MSKVVYQSPLNPDVTIIEPDPDTRKKAMIEQMERERRISDLRGEFTGILKNLPLLNARLQEIHRIQALLAEEETLIETEIEQSEARRMELETILKQR